jgi:16S rRNA (guanine527-N7)-methyltransferase
LIGSADPLWIIDNVIIDSLLFSRALPPHFASLCDVGSGAGIPGIPLKVVMPWVDVTLVESRARRASFLAAAIRELKLSECHVVNQRLEDAYDELRGRFDAVVMRCAGNPVELVASISSLLRPGGIMVASGPPTPSDVRVGEWLEVAGPRGVRRFWRYRSPDAPGNVD